MWVRLEIEVIKILEKRDESLLMAKNMLGELEKTITQFQGKIGRLIKANVLYITY